MDSKVNYTLVGAFVLIFLILMMTFALWVSHVNFTSKATSYEVYFTGSVTGLDVGSAVRYRGVRVGKVREIKIDSENIQQICVVISIEGAIPLREDASASLETMGLTGISYIQVNGGTHDKPPLRQTGNKYLVIPSRSSRLEEVVDSVPAVLRQASALIQDLRLLLSEENRQSIQSALHNLGYLMQSLTPQKKEGVSIGDLLHATIAQLKDSLQLLGDVSKEIHNVLKDNSVSLTRFLSKGFDTLDTFDRIGRSIEEGPIHFLSRDLQQGVRVP